MRKMLRVSLAFVGAVLVLTLPEMAWAQARKAPPGMFKDLDDQIVGDGIRFYYTGTAARHWDSYHNDPTDTSAVGLATLRLDGFVSVEAGKQEGTLTTRPLVFIGDALEISVVRLEGEQEARYDGDRKHAPPTAVGRSRSLPLCDAVC